MSITRQHPMRHALKLAGPRRNGALSWSARTPPLSAGLFVRLVNLLPWQLLKFSTKNLPDQTRQQSGRSERLCQTLHFGLIYPRREV